MKWFESVKVKQYGNTVLLQTLVKHPKRNYQQLGKTKRKSIERGQNLGSIKRTMRNIRELIAVNFDGESGAGGVFLTLTFADLTIGTDVNAVQREVANFLKRLKRKIDNLVYLAVIEPQPKRSDSEGVLVWHFHILIKTTDNEPVFVPQKELQDLWGNGIVFVERLQKYRSVSAYLSAYLTNLKVSDDETISKDKRFIKGQKLLLYPAGIRIYRASQNIKRPEVREFSSKQKALQGLDIDETMLKYHSAYEWGDSAEDRRKFVSEYYLKTVESTMK